MNDEHYQDIVELFDLPGARTMGVVSQYRDLEGADAEESRHYGHLALKEGDYPAAIQHFHRAIEQGDNSEEVIANLGAAYEASGETSEAFRQFVTARQMKASGGLDIAIASLLRQDGRAREGLAELESAIQREPDSAYLHFRRADLLRSMGYRKAALTAVLGAIALAPDDPFYHEWAGELANEAGLYAQALSSLQAAIELSPGDARLLALAAVAFFGEGKASEAVRAARLASDMEPDNAVYAHLRRRVEKATNSEPPDDKPVPEMEPYDRDVFERLTKSLGSRL